MAFFFFSFFSGSRPAESPSSGSDLESFQHTSWPSSWPYLRRSILAGPRVQGEKCCDLAQPKRLHLFQTPQVLGDVHVTTTVCVRACVHVCVCI